MALNGAYISSKELLGEVMRDNKYSYELPVSDAIEFIVDSVELIGVPMAYQKRQARIKISNYRGLLPCDVHDVEQVAGSFDGCSTFSMRSSTNTFHPVFTCDLQVNQELLGVENTDITLEQPIGQDIAGNPIYPVQNSGSFSFPKGQIDNIKNISGDYTYELNDSFIFPNFKDGYVFIAYEAFPVDKEGFPLIPDNRRFKEAVKSFIRYKIDYILWRTGELDEKMFKFSESEYLFYVASAGNAARTPNRDQLQSLLQQMKLIPSKYSHDQMFNKLGSK